MNRTVFHSQWGSIRTMNLITTTTTIGYARLSATWESSWRGLTGWIQLSLSKKIHIPVVSVEACANQTLGGYLLLNFGCISQKTAKHNQIPPAP